ncbi:hypothetical protein MAR_008081 [Mya arenaria]|uniref:Uncharacterized protein n=1 Tax=Mya arenaria TaxID=6604 RepID=A0ABY7DY16_MYAAR|nr:hypothetical protein MAR_008081 [Mya arenaria]
MTRELLDIVYAEHVVPLMLSGKAISRALRRQINAYKVLCSLLAMKAFLIDSHDNLGEKEEDGGLMKKSQMTSDVNSTPSENPDVADIKSDKNSGNDSGDMNPHLQGATK